MAPNNGRTVVLNGEAEHGEIRGAPRGPVVAAVGSRCRKCSSNPPATRGTGVTKAPATTAPASSGARPRRRRGRASGADRPDRLCRARQGLGARPSPSTARRSPSRSSGSAARATTSRTSVADFAKPRPASTIVVDRVGSSHETVLRTRIEGNDAARPGDARPAARPSSPTAQTASSSTSPRSWSRRKLGESTPRRSGCDGRQRRNIWGIPYKVDVKSTVWYPIKAFAGQGLHGPDDVGRADHSVRTRSLPTASHPWCIGMEAGTATGWQATDWLEDIMLRTTRHREVQQVDHPRAAVQLARSQDRHGQGRGQDLLHRTNYVYGGSTAIVATTRPIRWIRCSTATRRYPRLLDAEAGDLVRPRLLPGCQGQCRWHRPSTSSARTSASSTSRRSMRRRARLLTAGDTLMVLADRPEVKAVAEFLAHAAGHPALDRDRQRHLGQQRRSPGLVRGPTSSRSQPTSSKNAASWASTPPT